MEIKDFINKVSRLKIKETRQVGFDVVKEEKEYIALVLEPKMMFEISHPIDVSTKNMRCGGMTLDRLDVISIEKVGEEEFNLWKEKYTEFHNEIVKEKGYDFCEVDLDGVSF